MITHILQAVVAFVLLNVWLIRPNTKTPYRGGSSHSLKEEFGTYGLPDWAFYVVGCLKVTAALLLLVGLWVPALVFPAALTVTLLMLGALIMHGKIGDPLKKSAPALLMFLCSLAICLNSI